MKRQALLKHKLQWLALTALLGVSQCIWGYEVYMTPNNSWWANDNAAFSVWAWESGKSGKCFSMSVASGSGGTAIYTATIDDEKTNLQFIRGKNADCYTSKWNNTGDLSWDSSKPLYTFASDGNSGTWGTYTPPCTEPSAQITTDTQTRCVGGSFTSITVSTEGTVSSYQWKVSTDGSSYSNVSDGEGGATATFTPSSATPGTRYYKCTVSGCNTSVTTANFVTCTTNGVAISSVSPAVGNIHEYVPTTFTASGSATWSISEVPDGAEKGIDAYLSSTSGASTIFKGAKGTSGSYKVRATANGCDTDTTFSVAEWDDDCN